MMRYTCAIREVKTKLEVLNDELSVKNQRKMCIRDRGYGLCEDMAYDGDGKPLVQMCIRDRRRAYWLPYRSFWTA